MSSPDTGSTWRGIYDPVPPAGPPPGSAQYAGPSPAPAPYAALAAPSWAAPAGAPPARPRVSVEHGTSPVGRPTSPVGRPVRKSRLGLVLGLVSCGLVAVLLVAVVVGAQRLGEGQLVTSDDGRASLILPRTWSVDAPVDAGEVYEQGTEYEYQTPAISGYSFWGTVYLDLYVERGPLDVRAVHRDQVSLICDNQGCPVRGTPTTVTIDGGPAIEQLLEHDGYGATLVVTRADGTDVVQVVAVGEDAADVESLQKIVETLDLR